MREMALLDIFSRKNLYIFLVIIAGVFALQFGLQVFAPQFQNEFLMYLFLLAAINTILAGSLNLVNGWTGQFSLGHAGFMAIGAYVSAVVTREIGVNLLSLASDSITGQVLFFFATVTGGLAAALGGLLVGLPSLNLKGDYLAIATLGFSEIIRVLILNIDAIGGARGYSGIPGFSNFFWIVSWSLFSCYVFYRLCHSRTGRQWIAVREDEVAMESLGMSSTRSKVSAFVLSSFFAGVAGALFAHFLNYLNPGSFQLLKTTECLIFVVLGGMGSLTGSVIAALSLTFLLEWMRNLGDWRMVIYSLLLVVVMLVRPQGLLGRFEIWDLFQRKRP